MNSKDCTPLAIFLVCLDSRGLQTNGTFEFLKRLYFWRVARVAKPMFLKILRDVVDICLNPVHTKFGQWIRSQALLTI